MLKQLLHLHPLTLEDILQQDPREKLEHFPKLGYYFIVFRAIESQKTRQLHSGTSKKDSHNSVIGEGIVGEVNVYLIVFRGGICSVSNQMSTVLGHYLNGPRIAVPLR